MTKQNMNLFICSLAVITYYNYKTFKKIAITMKFYIIFVI